MGFLFILLQILKWIGIVLAGLVGLVLLIILLLLFVPFRYELKGEKYDKACAEGKVTWLLRSVRLEAVYEGGKSLVTKIKVLMFTVKDLTSDAEEDDISDEELEEFEKDDTEPGDVPEDQAEDGNAVNGEPEERVPKEGTPEDGEHGTQTIAEHGKTEAGEKTEDGEKPPEDDRPEAGEKTPEGDRPESKDKPAEGGKEENGEKPEAGGGSETGGEKDTGGEEDGTDGAPGEEQQEKKERRCIGEILQDINDKILEILEKPGRFIESLDKKRGYIIKFIERPESERTVKLLKKQVIRLLKAILPKKGMADVKLGTGDPYSTGELLAGAALLYVPCKKKLKVVPDFENKIFEGKADIKGRIFLFTLVDIFLKVWFNKDFKATKKNFERLKTKLKK